LVNTVTGGCSSPSATQTITVKSKPIVSINASSSICAGNTSPSASVATCSGTISAYTWTLAGATPATANTLSPGAINYATPGSYTIALDVTNECGVTSASKPITIKDIPDVTVPASQVACAGAASGLLSFSGSVSGTSYTWTNDATGIGLGGSGSGSSIPSFTLANSTTSPIISTINVVPSVSGCAGPAGTFSITVNPKPSVPIATTPVNYCQNSIAVPLTATPTSGSTLLWYNNPGLTGGSATAPTPSTAAGGTTHYYVTQQNAYNCLSNAANITVSVTASIMGNAITADQTICSGTSATTLTSAALSGGNNSFSYQWESSPDGVSWANATGAATGASYSPGAITATRYYRRKVSSGACSEDISNVVVITVQPGLSGTAITANQNICQGTTPALLSGNTITGATGSYTYTWESSLNGTSWSSLGAAGADYQPTAPAVTTFYRRTVTSGSCTAVSSVTVTVTPTVGNATIGSAQTICTGSTANILSGAAPTGGNGVFSYQWQSSPDGSSWANAGGASTGISYAPGAITATTYYRRNASSGSCILVPSNSIMITVLPALTNTGISADQAICENNPTALLHGALPAGGNGSYTYTWESSVNNTTWTPITGSNTQDYTPPVLHTTTFYRRTVLSDMCNATSSSVKITIYNTPTAGTLSQTAVNTCYGSDVTLSTSGFVGTVKTWQTNATPSNPLSWVDVPASAGSSVTFTSVQNSFAARVIVQQDGGCGNEATSVSIPVTVSIPTVPGTTASDATVCINSNNGTVNLSGQTGNVVRWEASTNNGNSWSTISNTTTAHTYHNLTTTTLFRAIVQSGFCSQQSSTSTRITVVPNLTPSNAGTDQSLCAQAGITLNGNNPAVGTGMWTQTGGPAATIANPLLSNTTISGIQNGQVYKFTWTITGPGCPSSADEVQVVNTPPITAASAGPDQLVCSFVGPTESITLAGNTLVNPAFETGTWSLVSVNPAGTSPAIANIHTPNSSFNFSRAGAYTLRWTINNGACASTNDQVVVNVFDKPVTGPLTPSATVGCIGNDITVTTGNTLRGVISKWQYNFTTLTSQTWTDTAVTNNSIVFTNVQRSFNVRMITISAGAAMGCSISDTSAVPVEIIPDFSNDIDTTPLSVCPGQSISIAGQLPSGAYNVFAYQWQQSKDGKTGWTDIPGQTFTNLNMIPLATSYVRRMVIVSPCSKASIPVYIFVRPSAGNFLMSDSVGTCFPFDVTFTNLVLPSTVTTWNFGDGAFNEGDVITHTYQSTGTFQVVMTAQYPGGCKFEATKQVTITGPKGILKYDLQSVCTGKQVYFEAASAGIDSVRWNFGDGTSLVTRSQIIFHSYQQAGPYVPYAELLAGPGGKCRTRLNGLDTVFVDQVTAGFRHNLVQECGATRAAFSDTSRAFYGIASHQWEFGDGAYSSEVNPIHTYLGANTWNVREIVIAKGGCRDTAEVPVPVNIWSIPQVKTNLDSIACVGQTVPYQASVFSQDAIRSTVWNFSNGLMAPTLNAAKIFDFPGNYLTVFIATTVNGCADTVRLPIIVYPKLSIELGPDRILPTGYKLRLTSTITNGPVVRWQWTPPTYLDCSTCSVPEATVKKEITYRAVAVTAHGCEASDTIAIKPICEDAQLFIPNVFSPDGDGINDVLMVRGQGIRLVKSFRIFNRWGAIVFERSNFSPNDKTNGWDGRVAGKPVAPDVYVYTCEAVCENDISFQRHGNITVIKNKQ
jgi:gliding motility-associated-like protein